MLQRLAHLMMTRRLTSPMWQEKMFTNDNGDDNVQTGVLEPLGLTRSQQRAQVILQPGFKATTPLCIVGLMKGNELAAHHQEVGFHIKECNCHVASHAILRPLPPRKQQSAIEYCQDGIIWHCLGRWQRHSLQQSFSTVIL